MVDPATLIASSPKTAALLWAADRAEIVRLVALLDAAKDAPSEIEGGGGT